MEEQGIKKFIEETTKVLIENFSAEEQGIILKSVRENISSFYDSKIEDSKIALEEASKRKEIFSSVK